MRIYGISGLGADERVFLRVNEFLERPIEFVPWIVPNPKETLSSYAYRLADTLDTSEPFALVGVSFGGMISSEMNKIISPERTVLVSSAACRKELPRYFRGAGKLGIVPYLPKRLLNVPKPLINIIASLKDEGQRAMVHDIMEQTDPIFLKWAVQSILTWDNDDVPANIRRIHGKADRLLPLRAKANYVVEGGHLVIVQRPEEMAGLIEKELS